MQVCTKMLCLHNSNKYSCFLEWYHSVYQAEQHWTVNEWISWNSGQTGLFVISTIKITTAKVRHCVLAGFNGTFILQLLFDTDLNQHVGWSTHGSREETNSWKQTRVKSWKCRIVSLLKCVVINSKARSAMVTWEIWTFIPRLPFLRLDNTSPGHIWHYVKLWIHWPLCAKLWTPQFPFENMHVIGTSFFFFFFTNARKKMPHVQQLHSSCKVNFIYSDS